MPDIAQEMQIALGRQKAAFQAAMPESLSVRDDRLKRAAALLLENKEALASAASADFGHRSRELTLLADIMPAVSALRHARRHMRAWARGERRRPIFPLGLLGAKAEVRFQPKGVVGIMAPWNFPIGMVMTPLACVLSAGNRAMVKPSEFTERTSNLMAELAARYFAPDEVAVFTGGVEQAQAFSALPFDHLIFTGATSVGRHVMRAAAENLVPVTLELGGKSPTIISRSADVEKAAGRIALGKMMNAGQVCIAPDYLLVPREKEEQIVAAITRQASAMYPLLLDNDDHTSIVNGRHRSRLQGLLDDARAKGAELVEVNPAGEDFAASNGNRMPLTLLRNVNADMRVMQEEIFGPILPVLPYDSIDEAITYVNAHDRPLALYYFGRNAREQERVLSRTHSGGVTINDVIMHISNDDLPFGGIGPSGMGHYHGFDGFRTFSHARAVFHQTGLDVAGIAGLRPPYGKATALQLRRELGK